MNAEGVTGTESHDGPWVVGRRALARRLLGAAVAGWLADGLFLVALPLAAAAGGAGPLLVGGIAAAQNAWWLCVVPLAGVVDRLGVGPALRRLRPVRLVLAALAAVAAQLPGPSRCVALLAVAVVWGFVEVTADTAVQTMPALLLGEAEYDRVYARFYAAQRAAGLVVGPALAAVLVAAATWLPFVAAAVLLAVSVGVQWPLLGDAALRRPGEDAGAGDAGRREVREGWRFLRGERFLLAVVITLVGIVVAEELVATILPTYVRDTGLPHWESLLASGRALAGVVTIGVALAAAAVARRLGRDAALCLAAAGGVAAPLVLAVGASPVTVVGALVVSAASESLWVPLVQAEVMRRTPRHLMVRSRATFLFLTWGSLPLAGIVGGAAATEAGYRATLLGAAAAALVTCLLGIWRVTLTERDAEARAA
jgi:hypothetical protein